MADEILNSEAAAKALGVTTQRVRALIHAGRLPAERLGREFMIRRKDLALVKVRKPGRPPKAK